MLAQQQLYPETQNPYLQSYGPIVQQLPFHIFRGNNNQQPFTQPQIINCYPQRGAPGNTVTVELRSQRDLFAPPKVYFSLFFGTKRCSASLTRMDCAEPFSFRYNVSGAIPQLDTMAWLEEVPLYLSMDGADNQNYGMLGCGNFTFDAPFETPIYDSTPSYSRKRRSSVDETDPFTSPTKRPFVRQLPDKETCVPRLLSSFSQNDWKSDGLVPRGFNGPPPSFQLADIAPRSSSLDDQVLSPRTANYTPEHVGSIFDDKFSTGLGIMAPTYSTPTPNRVSLVEDLGNPQLLRTSTIQSTGTGLSGSPPGLSSYGISSNKATLKMDGNLDAMAENWTDEECLAKRRIVQFDRRQSGSIIHATFAPVMPETRSPNSICVSCIWWEEKSEAYVTSVDTIHLLESLVGSRFCVEEKNRIRRNLEGFRPLTVSKARSESDSFFKTIMAFPNPKPRNIEKDVKVFPWKILSPALKKIIGKYSAAYASPVPSAPSMTHQASSASFMSSVDMQNHSRVMSPMPFDTMAPSNFSSFDHTAFPGTTLSPRLLSLRPHAPMRSSSAGRVTDQPSHHYQQEWRRRQSSDGQISQFQLPTNCDFNTYLDQSNDMSVLSSIPPSTFPGWCGDAFGRHQMFPQLDQITQP